MEKNENLCNAAIIGENHESAFLVEGNNLHAVEKLIADRQKDKSDPKKVLPLIRKAVEELIVFANGKVENHFLEVDWKSFKDQADEHERLVSIIDHIFRHLPHHDRNELSSMIHHKLAK